METTTHTNTATATTADTDATATAASRALSQVETSFKAYTVLSAIALTAVIAMAGTGHTVNTFMWVRGLLLPAVAVLLYRMSLAASRGSYRAFDRVRTLTLITPIAIIAVDLIPGVCPLWYAALQTLCMLPVIAAAVTIRRPALRAAFPKTR